MVISHPSDPQRCSSNPKASETCQTPEKPVPDTQVLLSSCSPCRVTAHKKSNYLATCPQGQRTRNPLKIIDFLLEIPVRQKKGRREEGAFCSYLEGGMLQTAPPSRLAWQNSPSLPKPESNRCPSPSYQLHQMNRGLWLKSLLDQLFDLGLRNSPDNTIHDFSVLEDLRGLRSFWRPPPPSSSSPRAAALARGNPFCHRSIAESPASLEKTSVWEPSF
jgi:hypothetical protein